MIAATTERGKGRFYLPELYGRSRVFSLLFVIASAVVWLITGFNVYEGSARFIAIQWSSLVTFAFFFYILLMNFQVGGVRSLQQFFRLLKMDLFFVLMTVRHPMKAGQQYPKDYIVNPWLAFFVSGLACIGALFFFEIPWVFLYDWFQFHSLDWPVNMAVVSYGWYHGSIAIRNVGLASLLLLGGYLLAIGLELQGVRSGKKLLVSWRLNIWWLAVVGFAIWTWALWIYWPHPLVSIGQVSGYAASTYSSSACYVFPSQGLFPQNSYTFYPCAVGGKHYLPTAILGFFNPDNWIHGINILAKFATFAAVLYPLMVTVKRL